MAILTLVAMITCGVLGGPSTLPPVRAVRIPSHVILDGRLTEALWSRAVRVTDFTQSEPAEGATPTESTVVFVAYDDQALYVAARLYDTHPDSIVTRLGRRDDATGSDQFTVFLDPYHDGRSGYFFRVDAAGTLGDGTLYNDDWSDSTWDGVWEGQARVDSLGWTAELRIPFSQLRFQAGALAWGVDFERDLARRHEQDLLVFTPRNGAGFVSRFVDLVGLGDLRSRPQVELVPYVRTQAEYAPHAPGDPFHTGSDYSPGAGVDARLGLGANLTLNATINPDFGQVEVDPAVVNLSDIETFYQEKRPFFVEGATLFDNFGQDGANSYWSFGWQSFQIFYSRRIGRAPQGSIPTGAAADSSYADVPSGTHILGAVKLTGTALGGWTVGAISAVTSRETAALDTSGVRFTREVEPLSYYGAAAAQRPLAGGRGGIGLIATTALHDRSDPLIRDQVNGGAFAGAVEGWWALDPARVWVVTGEVGGSVVSANPQRIVALETDPVHYFQQPDRRHAHVDSAATTLSGSVGRFTLNTQSGRVFVNAAFGWQTPGVDVTDLGYQARSGLWDASVVGGYFWNAPGRVFRQVKVAAAAFRTYDYDGNVITTGIYGRGQALLLDYTQFALTASYQPWRVDNVRTRGGPLSLAPPAVEASWTGGTDARRPAVLTFKGSVHRSADERMLSLSPSVQWRLSSRLTFTAGPTITHDRLATQYVAAFADSTANRTFGTRYVFVTLDQHEVSADLRMNWLFSPTLSLQLYLQPLISAGAYSDYKALAASRSYAFNHWNDGSSTFDSTTYTPPAQDFNLRSLRGTMVLRWEYRPGSTFYLVWTQRRQDLGDTGALDLGSSLGRLTATQPDNVLLAKFTYWVSW